MKKNLLFLLGLMLFSTAIWAQQIITGKVAGENGESLPGVSVRLKSSSVGSVTDATGSFSIKVTPKGTLVFSSVGYKNQEITIGSRNVINVSMTSDIGALEEVVVIGYGTQKKASLTGAVASVTSKDITAVPTTSIELALQGRVSGVQVTNNGSPGEAPIVRVRGIGSINYASNPLYIVDGFPVGGLNEIDTRDIETIDVLKDASSAAIYGSRAANGVILVTTKKGSKDGKVHVNVDSYYGVQNAWKKLTVLNTNQYLAYGKTLLANAGAALPDRWANLSAAPYTGSGASFANTNTDMQDYIFQTGALSQHTVSVNGGGDKSRFYTSFGYFKQDGIYVGTTFDRGNFRVNSDHKISKVFTFGQTFMMAMSSKLDEGVGGGRTALANSIKWVSYLPVYNPTEIGGFYGPTNADGSDPENAIIPATVVKSNRKNTRVLGTAYLSAQITDYLSYKFTAGLDYNTSRSLSRTPIYTAGQFGSPINSISDTRGDFVGTLFTNQITFDKTFGKHSINAIAVAEQQFGTYEDITAGGTWTTNSFGTITPNIGNQAVSGSKDEKAILSYLGRVNYDYGGRFLVSASIRRDGSSLFAPGKKWGTFPAVSVGWRMSEEKFMKELPSISELKVRASYGLVGNISGIPNYAWQSTIGASTNTVLNNVYSAGQSTNQLGNADLGWELTKMTDVGFDLGLYRNKLTLSADYYIRETTNNSLILERGLASTLGYTLGTIANLGSIRNTGLDIQLGYNHNEGDLKWNITGNISTLTNKVVSLESPLFRGNHGEAGNTVTKTEEGKTVQYLFGYIVDKIYQTKEEIIADDAAAKAKGATNYQGGNAAPGDIRFKDINGDGKVDDTDRTIIGNVLPTFTYGMNVSASYKNIDFTLFLQGVQGNDVYNNLKYSTQGMTRLFGQTTDVLNAWTPQNTNTNIPRAVSGDPNGNATRPSDRFVEKGSYMRVKNLSLGYSLPKSLLNSWSNGSISKVRVYVSTQNLLTITNYSGYDPEIGARSNNALVYGVDDGQYPQPRTFMAGIQLGF